MRIVRPTLFGGSILAAAVLVAACGSASPSDPAPGQPTSPRGTPAPPPPSITSPDDAAKQHAIAAYLGMWQDMTRAAQTSNWQDPTLGQHATGIALTNITRGLYADKTNGLVTKGQPKDTPRAVSADPPGAPTKVIISDCGDDSAWQHVRADNGQPADSSPSGRRQINAIVERQGDGGWRVTDFGIHEVGSC